MFRQGQLGTFGVVRYQKEVLVANLVDTAVQAGSFRTLASALEAAGLVNTLKGPGPFTVFAPTDEAFANLPTGTLEDLLKPANKAKLSKILTYHVVPGRVLAKDIKAGNVKTVEGSELAIKLQGQNVMVNDAQVSQADIISDNGVIHVVNKVLLPKE
jgi:uncharacterized surface protein with fasciclin (FAS1) repeats